MHFNMKNKYYFINKFDTNNINKQDKQTIIIYRNYRTISQDEKLLYCANCSLGVVIPTF